MLAYRIPDVAPAAAKERLIAGDHPGLSRLAPAGPWQFSAHHEGGTLATWKDTVPPKPDALGEAVPCADGLTYYRPKPLPTQDQLAKATRADDEIVVDLVSGLRLSILAARSAPRRLRFTGPSGIGDAATEYGALAFRVFDRMRDATPDAPVTIDDAEVRRLLWLAIAQRYRVTEELLDDLGWVTTEDVDPILCAVFGSNPKAFAAASGS